MWSRSAGYVSQEDYFLAKRFDLDGNGVLDPDEQEVKRFLAFSEMLGRTSLKPSLDLDVHPQHPSTTHGSG